MPSLAVQKIEDGTVIDHLPAGSGSRILQILSSSHPAIGMVALIMNAPSKKYGRKDIIKLEGVFLEGSEVDKISLLAPKATLNIIRKGVIAKKQPLKMPKLLYGIASCPNPKCITNFEQAKTEFRLEKSSLRCKHCERLFKPQELV